MGNLLIYSAADSFSIWPRALPRCRPWRASRGRKPIQRGPLRLSFRLLPAGPATFMRVLSASTWRARLDSIATIRLPAIYFFREFVQSGGLLSYGSDLADMYRRAAMYVDKIVKGASPGELPVQSAEKFELAVNLKAAKTLGLAISESFLLRADEVVE